MVQHTMDATGWLRKQLEQASPDLLRAMGQDFAEALMGAVADALCGAGYGERTPERSTFATASASGGSGNRFLLYRRAEETLPFMHAFATAGLGLHSKRERNRTICLPARPLLPLQAWSSIF